MSNVPHSGQRGPVVVGFSSPGRSQTAVRWAAREAERRTTTLCIVHAYPRPQLGQPIQRDVDGLLHAEAATQLDRVAVGIRREHPQLEVTTRLVQNAPANALRQESVGAALTVVGAKESGRLSRAILGSVASAIAASNPSPLAVIHPDHEINGTGPVVVGVGGSGQNFAAIEFAFAEAALRGTDLLAVHTWNESSVKGSRPKTPAHREDAAIEQEDDVIEEEAAVLSETLAGWYETYPDVEVTRAVRKGQPARVLLECARSAVVVVVGRRRTRGQFEALVMGSTSRTLTAHSSCPVVIAS